MSSGAGRGSGTTSGNPESCVSVELSQTKQWTGAESRVTHTMARSARIVDSVIRLRRRRGLEPEAVQTTPALLESKGREGDRTRCEPNSCYFEFGPFRLFPLERRLFKNNVPIDLGSRALDILILLSEHAGDVVGKHRIVENVWPGINVEESSLRVQIAKLRKALGEGNDGQRYIANIAGRGYSLVAVVERSRLLPTHQPDALGHSRVQSLPRISTPIGRERDIAKIKALVRSSGFVTLHGFGGVGKTTVGVAVAEELAEELGDGLVYLDIGRMRSSDEIEMSLARGTGMTAYERASRQRPSIFDALGHRQLLIMLDGCEHLLDAVTVFVEEARNRCPKVTFLVTSREQLRADGEHAYLLPPLEVPPDHDSISAADIMGFPSAQLFVERAVAAGYEPEFSDNEARYLARICAKLDGVPLALELVASRLVVHGLEETEALCVGIFALSWQGRRTAVARQQTLRSSLEWGYALLSETERIVLRRLSVFAGVFTLEEMQKAAVDERAVKQHDCVHAFSQLVAKSFVVGGRDGTFRLFQIARAYAWVELLEAREVESVKMRLNQCGQIATPRWNSCQAANALHSQLLNTCFDEMPGW